MLTLTNSFHGTSTQVRLTRAELDELEVLAQYRTGDLYIDRAQKAAARKLRGIRAKLCGSADCTCSGLTGVR